jgi:hypothetical protein
LRESRGKWIVCRNVDYAEKVLYNWPLGIKKIESKINPWTLYYKTLRTHNVSQIYTIHSNVVKNLFGLFSLLFSALVSFTSLTDKYWPQSSILSFFKSANSRQVQTCNIPLKGNTKKLQYNNWFTPVQEKWEFSWPWFTTYRFEDGHHQAYGVFTTLLSFGYVDQLHYHSKLVSFISSATSSLAWTNTLAYYGIRTLHICNVFYSTSSLA